MIFDSQARVKVSARLTLSYPRRTCSGFESAKQIQEREGLRHKTNPGKRERFRLDHCLEQSIACHKHKQSALTLELKMVVKAFSVDLNQPLVFQVGHLGDAYQEWVHQPIVSREGPRFFKSDFWEFLTRTAWWVIPLVWLPVVSWSILMAIQRGLSPTKAAYVVLIGILIWSLMEYSLHRFLFHIKTSSYWGNTLHYLLHGCHHKHPMDGYRLVFPPAATAILCIPFWSLVKLVTPHTVAPAVFGGGMLGYVMYDVTHYYLHHGRPSQTVAHNLKKYHLNHHFRNQTSGFGITSSLWDCVFGTLPPKKV